MFIQNCILELLAKESNLTANQIADKLKQFEKNSRSVKVVIYRMNKRGKLLREKKMREQKTSCGPQNIYTYSIKV